MIVAGMECDVKNSFGRYNDYYFVCINMVAAEVGQKSLMETAVKAQRQCRQRKHVQNGDGGIIYGGIDGDDSVVAGAVHGNGGSTGNMGGI